jgi:hypothetical protein
MMISTYVQYYCLRCAQKCQIPVPHLAVCLLLQKCFHPPYNKGTVIGLVTTIICLGAGSMQYGYMHQQYKQGYWK